MNRFDSRMLKLSASGVLQLIEILNLAADHDRDLPADDRDRDQHKTEWYVWVGLGVGLGVIGAVLLLGSLAGATLNAHKLDDVDRAHLRRLRLHAHQARRACARDVALARAPAHS